MANKPKKNNEAFNNQEVAIQLHFVEFNDQLDAAIAAVRDNLTRDMHHVAFFREIASAALAQPRGSTLLCASASGLCAERLARDVSRMLKVENDSKEGFQGTSICSAPFEYRLRPRPETLLRGYPLFGAAPAGGELHLESQSPNPTATWFECECSRLSHTGSTFYIINNVDRLQPPLESVGRGIEAILTYAEIAAATGRTHILIGNAATVMR